MDPVENPKQAIGKKKPGIHQIPPAALIHLGMACADGGAKYGVMNYREAGVTASIYYNAIGRHLLKWWDGHNYDPSGCHHLAHAMADCAILLDCHERGVLTDDRPPFGNVATVIDRFTASD